MERFSGVIQEILRVEGVERRARKSRVEENRSRGSISVEEVEIELLNLSL